MDIPIPKKRNMLLDAVGAFAVLLALMVLPAVIMLAVGAWCCYRGYTQHLLGTERLGRLLMMFGGILLAIVLVVSFFLTGKVPGG